MNRREAVQIFNGPGAGNIGDELMMHGFWNALPPDFHLHVFLHENALRQRQPYPSRFSYETISLPPETFELDRFRDRPGILAGTTCITDAEGWGWPLDFLAPRVRHFHDLGLPVDAVGVGVDFLVTPEGCRLFAENFRQIRSWSVRNEASRAALLDAGVEAERIVVGADWAWLYQPPSDASGWAANYLETLGIRTDEPLLFVNLFWQGRGTTLPIWDSVAAVLDRMQRELGMQIAFFCNECRHPGFDRTAAEYVQSRMATRSALIPNLYFGPNEAIALLRHATVALGQRYHFCVEAVLAGTVPVNLGRSPKIAGLSAELGITPCGSLEAVDPEELSATIAEAAVNRRVRRDALQQRQSALAERAARNLELWLLQ
jgi:polysaccharide pyruvyl transferase WcaK-like protein